MMIVQFSAVLSWPGLQEDGLVKTRDYVKLREMIDYATLTDLFFFDSSTLFILISLIKILHTSMMY